MRANEKAADVAAAAAATSISSEDEELECRGYRKSVPRTLFCHVVSVLLLGLPYLVSYWKPCWWVRCVSKRCALDVADTVIIVDCSDSEYVEEVKTVAVTDSFPADLLQYHDADAAGQKPSRDHSRLFRMNNRSGDRTHLLSKSDRRLAPIHRYFKYRQVKYVWSNREQGFVRLFGLDHDVHISAFFADYHGFSPEEQSHRQLLYGENVVDVEVKPYMKLLVEEVLNPFYIFQICSIILWCSDDYYYYAACIFFISAGSILLQLVETRRQSQSLHDMVSSSNDLLVTVRRGSGEDAFQNVPSSCVVPGDVIAIPPHGCIMPCDAVLVTGTCIVNESMLTGESVPVTKASLPVADVGANNDELYDTETHKRHTLFAGTSVIQTRYYGHSHVLAVIVRTGFSTSKGELVRSILYPKPMGFKFYQDSIRFILVLFGIAMLGMIYCLYVFIERRGASFSLIIRRCLDIVTIVVPPALPAAMTVGTYYAQNRLKQSSIFCISPQRINVAGKLKLICFDKTGTLTEEGLDMWGVISTLKNHFQPATRNVLELSPHSLTTICMTTCHSLTLIDNQLTGDPLDVKMFESTGWELEEAGEDTSKYDMILPAVVRPKKRMSLAEAGEDQTNADFGLEVGIIRQFTFSSSVARMSVITRTLGSSVFEVFAKGAPEKLVELCVAESVPVDFHEQLRRHTQEGLRVIALAHRVLPQELSWHKAQKLKREQVEQQLTFLGFLIMQNTLKPETTPVIRELRGANIRCVMVTGDNLLTAVSVARDCKMVDVHDRVLVVEGHVPESADATASLVFHESEKPDRKEFFSTDDISAGHLRDAMDLEGGTAFSEADYHFAVDGKSWAVIRNYFPHMLPKIILKGTIFARMSPDQKAQLVEEYQSLDYVVSMCGDGANDCGALKAAHVGISLSEAEASVAAPFTSHVANIECVPTVIREGRCALVTSFGVFKYMALYSMIQFISVLILYWMYTNLGDTQFLYLDLPITTTVAVLMGWTEAYPRLVRKFPPGSLVSGSTLFSLFAQILLALLVQLAAFFYLNTQSWYRPHHSVSPDEDENLTWETTTIFIVSSFQYLIVATAFSKGPPFRQPFYKNGLFLLSLLVLMVFNVILALYPGSAMAAFFNLEFDLSEPRLSFRVALLVFPLVHLVISIFVEEVVVESRWLKTFVHCLTNKRHPKNRYKRLLREMGLESWPPAAGRVFHAPAVS